MAHAEPAPLDVFGCPLDGATLIEASAGTGKTWAICGLVLRLLLERGLELPRVLVVTFTNAATAELRERVRERIAQTLARLRGTGPTGPDPFIDGLLTAMRERVGLADTLMTDRLALALQTFDEASIFTIHGFCQRALGDAPFSAGVPLHIDLVPDDGEALLQAVHDFWRQRIAGDALPPALAAHLLARRDTPEKHAVLLRQVLGKPLARVMWPADIEETGDAAAGAALQASFTAARALWLAEREAILAIVEDARPRLSQNRYKTSAALVEAAQGWDRWFANTHAQAGDAGGKRLELLSAASLRPSRGQAPLDPHPFFDLAERLLAQRHAVATDLDLARARLLRDLLTHATAALRASQRSRRVQSYDDLLVNLHRHLHGPGGAALAEALRERFPAALIDEFQDTDPLQFAIFSRLYLPAAGTTTGPTLFLVGDPKQAIYSFRNADLPTYLQARERVAREATLAHNQRSVPPLVDALNALFTQRPLPFLLPGLAYYPVQVGAKQRPLLHDSGAHATAALQLWSLPAGGEDGAPVLPKAEALQRAATACAAGIAALLARAGRGELQLGARALAAGDIAVLVRSHAHGARMRQALQALGVGCVELSQASVFASVDAEELERVLLAIVEPARDGAVRAALATELLGWDAAALAALADDDAPLAVFVQQLQDWQQQWLQRGVAGMLRRLMGEAGVTARWLARTDGERRLTNLRHLAEALHEAAAEHAAPEALLHWLQAQREEARHGTGNEAAQLRLESDRHLVQIVTIHKSKGLEYPIVFCPFLWDGHPGAPRRSGQAGEWHDGASQQTVIDLRALDEKDPELKRLKAAQAEERRAETLRLVYVALTRAVHRVVLVVGPYGTHGGSNLTECSRGPLQHLVGAAATDASPLQAWARFAQGHPAAVSLAPLTADAGVPLAPEGTAPDEVQALPVPGPVPPAWWVGSYSSLTQGARPDATASDHDARVASLVTMVPADEPAALADDDILRFPRGAAAGECLHAVFESIDFGASAGWPAAVDRALQQHGLATTDPARPAMVLRMLGDVLHTPLPGGPRLADVARARCVHELEFTLPVHELRASALAALLREHGLHVPGLSFATLQGYLRGFIDLVFEHGGRFHLVDWKSNHLGTRAADYAQPALRAAMDQHGYRLQALIYSLALHRWLGVRLAGYRPEQHLGNACYLFIRGMRPGWADADRAPCGVHVQRPPLALIERLSALIDPPRDPTR